jgi:hypothetical protein
VVAAIDGSVELGARGVRGRGAWVGVGGAFGLDAVPEHGSFIVELRSLEIKSETHARTRGGKYCSTDERHAASAHAAGGNVRGRGVRVSFVGDRHPSCLKRSRVETLEPKP